ncbi:MAG: sodium:proton antiporter [Lachnospiraceae bacterium]|nr:sodium:proton antiporter [Lachnospiraceae bacterium]
MGTLDQAYHALFVGAIIVLAIMICCCLVRAIIGPSIADRIVAINMIGTMTIMIIAILAIEMKESYLVDVSIIYAMISFLAVVVLTKVYMGVYKERAEKAKLENKHQEEEAK